MFSTILLSNALITPAIGLVFWQTVTFLIVLVLLSKFAWKPIMAALSDREKSIEDALGAAENAKKEMAKLTASNAELLKEARIERDKLLKDAKSAADKIVNDAKTIASVESEKIIANAQEAIEAQKKSALADVKNEVASLSLEIAEKLLRSSLSSNQSQKDLVKKYVGELNVA